MPKLLRDLKTDSERITIRLDRDQATYYRKRAQEHGVTVSEFLRNSIVQGMIAESALDIEDRMRAMVGKIQQMTDLIREQPIPEKVLKSLYLTEYMMRGIVESRDIQELYRAQDKAKARIDKEKSL